MKKAPAIFATHMYRACLFLYPPAFRDEFGPEMAADFESATTEAWRAERSAGVIACWARVALDLARSIATQWLRTGFPALAAISTIWALTIASLIANQFVPNPPIAASVSPLNADEEVTLMLVFMGVLIVVIAAVIFVTGYFWTIVWRRKRGA